MTGETTPFRIEVPQDELDDLLTRLAATRFPAVLGDGSDETGFTTAAARELLTHWRERFDWRAVEAELNSLDQVLVGTANGRVHVVRALSPGSAVPVVLLHGWPDSFLRYRHLLTPLTAAGHDVLVPSLPGFGFSDAPTGPATVDQAAEAVFAAVTALGVPRFAVHGGDWGSAVAEALAIARPEAVVALHLSDVPWQHTFEVEAEQAAPVEQEFLAGVAAWGQTAAYISVQSTQATTLALALADSPMGLAAWWAEKYGAWSDRPLDLDEVLTQVCLTWFTRTEHSGMRYYSAMEGQWEEESEWTEPVRAAQPTAFALFPADISVPPREFAQRFFPGLSRVTSMPRGGHFGALEEPDLLAADIAGFLAGLSG
jgi:epoxide hydrolase